MKLIVLCSLLFLQPPGITPDRARTLLVAAATNEDSAIAFFRLYQSAIVLTPLQEGYKGIAEIMMCNYGINPFTKFSRFMSGKAALEHALVCQPTSTELHFLRYIVQTKSPSILRYRSDLNNDKAILSTYLNLPPADRDEKLYNLIRSFLNQANT